MYHDYDMYGTCDTCDGEDSPLPNKVITKGPLYLCEVCRSLVLINQTKIKTTIKTIFGVRNKIETIYYECPACRYNVTIRETIKELPPKPLSSTV
jgi:hypothetical protein